MAFNPWKGPYEVLVDGVKISRTLGGITHNLVPSSSPVLYDEEGETPVTYRSNGYADPHAVTRLSDLDTDTIPTSWQNLFPSLTEHVENDGFTVTNDINVDYAALSKTVVFQPTTPNSKNPTITLHKAYPEVQPLDYGTSDTVVQEVIWKIMSDDTVVDGDTQRRLITVGNADPDIV